MWCNKCEKGLFINFDLFLFKDSSKKRFQVSASLKLWFYLFVSQQARIYQFLRNHHVYSLSEPVLTFCVLIIRKTVQKAGFSTIFESWKSSFLNGLDYYRFARFNSFTHAHSQKFPNKTNCNTRPFSQSSFAGKETLSRNNWTFFTSVTNFCYLIFCFMYHPYTTLIVTTLEDGQLVKGKLSRTVEPNQNFKKDQLQRDKIFIRNELLVLFYSFTNCKLY